jgi:RNA recognition motif-containing protein
VQTVKYSSKQKHKIYVCNIPRDKGRQELLESFRSHVRGVEVLDITMQKDQGRLGQNRGFCFLEMYNQAVAEEAMSTLSAPGMQLCGMCVFFRYLVFSWRGCCKLFFVHNYYASAVPLLFLL